MLIKFLFLFLFLVLSIYGYADRAPSGIGVSIEGNLSAMVDGCVNAITGDFVEASNDIVIVGPDPLVFERFSASSDYAGNNFCAGWRHNHQSWIMKKRHKHPHTKNPDTMELAYVETSGRAAIYEGIYYDNRNDVKGTLNLQGLHRGLTNCGTGILSAKTNPKNTFLRYYRNLHYISATLPNGSKLRFKEQDNGSFLLSREVKANGKRLFYSYAEDLALSNVKLTNSNQEKVFSSLTVEEKLEKKFPHINVIASDGQKVTYLLEKSKWLGKEGIPYLLHQVKRFGEVTDTYEYVRRRKTKGAMIACHKKSDGRYKKILYYSDAAGDCEDKSIRLNLVKELRAPVGTGREEITTYRFEYYVYDGALEFGPSRRAIDGVTDVYNAYSHKTRYHFEERRLTAIERFLGVNGTTLHSKEYYSWGAVRGPDAFNLKARAVLDGSMQPVVAKTYRYDLRGNVLTDKIYGQISGEGVALQWRRSRPAKNGCEHYARRFTYSEDGRNSLLSESEDNGKTTQYVYEESRERLKKKFIIAYGKIIQRHFYAYDENGVLAVEIFDDGSGTEEADLTGISVRKITRTFARKSVPFGVPEEVLEFYLDLATKQEVLLKKVVRSFSAQGKVEKEDVYDANGNYGYSLTYLYDPRGNLIEERGPLGGVTYRTYDANNNLTSERKPGEPYATHHSYDFSNRLIRSEELHDNGTRLITTHRYDLLGNRVATVDPFGQTTEYRYDELGNVIYVVYPQAPTPEGGFRQRVVEQKYDVLGNLIYCKDEEGYVTETRYNIYNQPLLVIHPNGAQERFYYNLDGTLKRHHTTHGTVIKYTRDLFDRVIKKEVYDAEGRLLSEERAHFNALHLLSTTDAAGGTTYYRYDGAGRLIAKEDAGHLTTYEYDHFSRLYKTHQWYDQDHCRTTILLYDLMGRVIDERVVEGDTIYKHQKFSYDMQGNVVAFAEVDPLSGQEAITITEYNWHRQLKKRIDPLNNVTHITYNYAARDHQGCLVLQTTVVDPFGNQTITTLDRCGHIASIIKKNVSGVLLAKKELFYTGKGDLYFTREATVLNGLEGRSVCTRWTYDALRHVTALVEAEGLPEQKLSYFSYNQKGEKISHTKPDGTVIYFHYDKKGRLARSHASDGSFDDHYQYDSLDRVVSVHDSVHDTLTERVYNLAGRLEKEQLGNGLCIQYCYDRLDRPVDVVFSDGSSVHYRYDGGYLKEIERNGSILAYDHFSKEGHPQKMVCASGKIEIAWNYDLCGRCSSVQGGGFCESVVYNAIGNVVKMEIKADVEEHSSEYFYDDLHQITAESGIAQHSYCNDSLYNCVERDGKKRSFNALHQLVQEGETSYSYDLNGNLIRRYRDGKETSYEYDALDRLVAVCEGESVTRYIYDAFNRRLIKKEGNNESVYYLYHGQNEVGAADASGKIFQLRVLGVGKGAEIGAAVLMELQGKTFYPLHDHNGNVLALFDEEGCVAESYRYSAFGQENIFDTNGESLVTSLLGNPWRFSSKRFDKESGFVYFGRRYYDPAACRWISPDPMGFEAGPNFYAYVMNNPLSHIDLYGLVASKGEGARVRFFPQVFQFLHRALDYVRAIPGRCVEFVGIHFMPIPIVSNVVQMCGRFLSGAERLTYKSSEEYDSSKSVVLGGSEEDPVRCTFFPGMLNREGDAIKAGKMFSEDSGGIKVQVCHGSSLGFLSDIMRILGVNLGVINTAIKNSRDALRDVLASLPIGRNHECVAHSRGGLYLYKTLEGLSEEQRKKINVTTYGTAKIIDQAELGLGKAENYISIFDPIPFIADPIGVLRGIFTDYGNITFFIGRVPFFDHSFDSHVYRSRVIDHGKRFNP